MITGAFFVKITLWQAKNRKNGLKSPKKWPKNGQNS
jgi:hypothetical protein